MNKSDRLAALCASLGLYLELPMKISVLVVVCTAFAGQVAAASLSGGYSVGALSYTCNISGQGSGSLTESSSGCNYLTSGSFTVSGSGEASYDTLRATASAGFSAVDPNFATGSTTNLATAIGLAEYQDMITIDISGRQGETVDLVFTTAMNGTLTAIGDSSTYGQADASLQVNVNGTDVYVLRNAKSAADPAEIDYNPGKVQIVLGTPFSVDAILQVKARLQSTTTNGVYTGDVFANFGNSAGITSFELFETGSEISITNWNLTSESGEFGFYTAVPVPASAWLFGSGLLGLIGMSRRKITS